MSKGSFKINYGNFRGVSSVLQGRVENTYRWLKDVLRNVHGCFKSALNRVKRKFKKCSKFTFKLALGKYQGCFKGSSRRFPTCLKKTKLILIVLQPIKIVWLLLLVLLFLLLFFLLLLISLLLI